MPGTLLPRTFGHLDASTSPHCLPCRTRLGRHQRAPRRPAALIQRQQAAASVELFPYPEDDEKQQEGNSEGNGKHRRSKAGQRNAIDSLTALLGAFHEDEQGEQPKKRNNPDQQHGQHAGQHATKAAAAADAQHGGGLRRRHLLDSLFGDDGSDDGEEGWRQLQQQHQQPRQATFASSRHATALRPASPQQQRAAPPTFADLMTQDPGGTLSLQQLAAVIEAHRTQPSRAPRAGGAADAPPAPSPNKLLSMLRARAEDGGLPSLLDCVREHHSRLEPRHTCLALRLAAKLSGSAAAVGAEQQRRVLGRGDAEALRRLLEALAARLGAVMKRLEPRQAAVALWSLASLQYRDPLLLGSLLRRTRDLLPSMQPAELGSVAWACARLGVVDGEFLDELEAAAIGALARQQATDQAAAATSSAEGSATALPAQAGVLNGHAAGVTSGAALVSDAKGKGGKGGKGAPAKNDVQFLAAVTESERLVDMAWAMATMQRYSQPLFKLLFSRFAWRMDTLHPPSLVTLVATLDQTGHHDAGFARAAIKRLVAEMYRVPVSQLLLLITMLMKPVAAEVPTAAEAAATDGQQQGGAGSGSGDGAKDRRAAAEAARDARRMARTLRCRDALREAVAQLRWRCVCRRSSAAHSHRALDVASASDLLATLRAVVALNDDPAALNQPAAAVNPSTAGRLGPVNEEWVVQQQRLRDWQRQQAAAGVDVTSDAVSNFAPVVLACYDDVVFVRALLDKVARRLRDYGAAELLQVLCLCARVGFTHAPDLVLGSMRQLKRMRAKLGAWDIEVLAWALQTLGYLISMQELCNEFLAPGADESGDGEALAAESEGGSGSKGVAAAAPAGSSERDTWTAAENM